MSWNYRIVRRRQTFSEATLGAYKGQDPRDVDGEFYYAIHSVYYNEDGTVRAWSHKPAIVLGGDLQDIITNIHQFLDALNRPILYLDDVPELACSCCDR